MRRMMIRSMILSSRKQHQLVRRITTKTGFVSNSSSVPLLLASITKRFFSLSSFRVLARRGLATEASSSSSSSSTETTKKVKKIIKKRKRRPVVEKTTATAASSSSRTKTSALEINKKKTLKKQDNFKKQHLDGTCTSLSVVTWNILASKYETSYKYERTSDKFMDWSTHRKPLIVKTLLELNADIVCLQEIQSHEIWNDLWDSLKLKYKEGYLQERPVNAHNSKVKKQQRFMRNAILIHKKANANVIRTESRLRALIVVLQLSNKEKNDNHATNNSESTNEKLNNNHDNNNHSYVYLANIHCSSGLNDDEARYRQIQTVLYRIENMIHNNKRNHIIDANSFPPTVILAGDMNIYHNTPLHEWLETGTFPPPSSDSLTTTTTDTSWQEEASQSPKHPLLPLRDAWKCHPPLKHSTLFTHTSGKLIDYIWVSPSVKIRDTFTSAYIRHSIIWGESQSLQWHSKASKGIPNQYHPSDHIPVGATFLLKHNK